jgi:type II secretory pathway pseudopilin PulG
MFPLTKFKSTKVHGFTMIELVLSILILSTVIVTALKIFSPTTTVSAKSQELSKLTYYLQDQSERIKATGFWVWEGDTASANNNAMHPIMVWQTRLATLGYTGRAKMAVSFLKYSGNTLIPFTNNARFDGINPRNTVQVTLTLYTSQNQPISESFVLTSSPTDVKCWANLAIIKRALLMYAANNGGAYPATTSIADQLVGTYIDEIPNDPYRRGEINHAQTHNHYPTGNITQKLAPPNSDRFTPICPRCNSMVCLQIASPSPVPLYPLLPVERYNCSNRLNNRWLISSDTPAPSSCT